MKTVHHNDRDDRVIRMMDMEPLQLGVIVDDFNCNNTVVMRTASRDKIEIIDLSEPEANGCWTIKACPLMVRLFAKGESITLTQE